VPPCRREETRRPQATRRARPTPRAEHIAEEGANERIAALEAALEDSEQRLRLITEVSQDILCFIHLDGVFAYVSPAFAGVLGYPPEEIAGTHFDSYFETEEAVSAAAIFERVAGGERVPPVEVTARHRDGHAVPLEVSAAPVVRDGRTVGVYGIARDITRRRRAEEGLRWYTGHLESLLKQGDDRERRDRETFAARLRRHHDAEAALRDDQELLRGAIETAPFGVAIVDTDGGVLWFSRRFQALVGMRAARLEGRPLATLINPADRSELARMQARVLSGTAGIETAIVRLAKAPPAAPPARVTLALVRQPSGLPRCLVVAVEPQSAAGAEG
jgi:PAS domain S-box-containing protein